MLFAAISIGIGLWKSQPKRYWLHAIGAIGSQLLVGVLFSGDGSLANPAGDGLITALARSATNDGPEMAFLGIAAILLGWGVPIWLLHRGFVRRGTRQAMPVSGNTGAPDSR